MHARTHACIYSVAVLAVCASTALLRRGSLAFAANQAHDCAIGNTPLRAVVTPPFGFVSHHLPRRYTNFVVPVNAPRAAAFIAEKDAAAAAAAVAAAAAAVVAQRESLPSSSSSGEAVAAPAERDLDDVRDQQPRSQQGHQPKMRPLCVGLVPPDHLLVVPREPL